MFSVEKNIKENSFIQLTLDSTQHFFHLLPKTQLWLCLTGVLADFGHYFINEALGYRNENSLWDIS